MTPSSAEPSPPRRRSQHPRTRGSIGKRCSYKPKAYGFYVPLPQPTRRQPTPLRPSSERRPALYVTETRVLIALGSVLLSMILFILARLAFSPLR